MKIQLLSLFNSQMKNTRKVHSYIFIILNAVAVFLAATNLYADQAQYLSENMAKKVSRYVKIGDIIREYCKPCDETGWKAIKVTSLEIKSADYKDNYEVLLNGNSTDIAYIYIKKSKKWLNLALLLGMDVTDVSRELPANIASRIQPETAEPEGEENRTSNKEKYNTFVSGRFVWDNGKPVTNCLVKLVGKIEFFTGNYWGQSIRQFKIADGAYEQEIKVNPLGQFKFEGVPPGIYYLFWRASESEDGDEWMYLYTKPANIFYLMGAMPEPNRHKVIEGKKTIIPDIKIKRSKSDNK